MLLGEYAQKLDEKNRVTVPSRLREPFADGLFVTRGLDGSSFRPSTSKKLVMSHPSGVRSSSVAPFESQMRSGCAALPDAHMRFPANSNMVQGGTRP